MSILEDIYTNHYEANVRLKSPESMELRRELYALWEQMENVMGHEAVDTMLDKEAELHALEQEASFRAGFRLGAGLIAELL